MIKNKRIIKFSGLKLALVSLSVSLLSAVLPVGTTSVTAEIDCLPGRVFHLPTYGGNYYCSYGTKSHRFPDGTLQVFVIGTDFSVWTRWQKNGRLSNWVSLGGKIRHTYNSSDFKLYNCNGPWLLIYGLDNRPWLTTRGQNGVWSPWVSNDQVACSR